MLNDDVFSEVYISVHNKWCEIIHVYLILHVQRRKC